MAKTPAQRKAEHDAREKQNRRLVRSFAVDKDIATAALARLGVVGDVASEDNALVGLMHKVLTRIARGADEHGRRIVVLELDAHSVTAFLRRKQLTGPAANAVAEDAALEQEVDRLVRDPAR